MAPARWLALLICFAPAVGCGDDNGGGGGAEAPPSEITLDAYASHNEAVEVQERWQESDDPDAAGLCSEFYESPDLAEALRDPDRPTEVIELGLDYEDLLGGASPAQMEAAEACAEGTELQPWHDDELEKELAAREQAAEAEEAAVSEATADLIGVQSRVCSTVHDELAPRGILNVRAVSALEDALTRELEADPGVHRMIPRDVDLGEVAGRFVLACAEHSPPELAAEAMRNPGTPIDELKDNLDP